MFSIRCDAFFLMWELQMRVFNLIFTFILAIPALSLPVPAQNADSLGFILGDQNLGQWKNEIYGSGPPAPSPGAQSTLVLAARRTKRPDFLHGFKMYRGGWDITNRHYWASVGFTGATGFIVAALWIISFGLIIIMHYCCGWKINIKGKDSRHFVKICRILLIVFTCIAAIGCIFLSIGQDQFRDEAIHTLNYVVNQSDYTVQTLKNVTEYLSLAKTINVAQVFLPANVKNDIDHLNVDLNTAADTLAEKTSDNSKKIRRVFNAMRSALITVAAVMLTLTLLGLFLSIAGHRHTIHIFILGGWLLVAVTFFLCGVFTILNNAISDTCIAMEEYVEYPHAETALSNILPCVDPRTTKHTLVQSRQVITNIVNVVNTVIYTVANSDRSHNDSMYYNQSGPFMPPLCYPYDSQLHDQQCGAEDVTIANASQVWQNYTCVASAIGICTGTGRVTPTMYEQLVAAVNVSYALQRYAPPLLSLKDCNFVRDTFHEITSRYCHPLGKDLQMVDAGLGLISAGVMLCLLLWILYSNRPKEDGELVKPSSPNIGVGSTPGCSHVEDCEKVGALSNASPAHIVNV